MQKLARQFKNEDGYFLIISTMMLLALITIISVAASNTARTEVQVAGNDLTYQRNLYLAEGAAMQAVDLLHNATNPRDTVEVPFVHPGLKAIDDDNFKDDWDENSLPVATSLDSSDKTRFRAGYEGTPPGYSLGLGKPRVHGFVIYGRTEKQGVTTIKIGYRRAF
jgi:Tfp pilus assembly protein PilX